MGIKHSKHAQKEKPPLQRVSSGISSKMRSDYIEFKRLKIKANYHGELIEVHESGINYSEELRDSLRMDIPMGCSIFASITFSVKQPVKKLCHAVIDEYYNLEVGQVITDRSIYHTFKDLGDCVPGVTYKAEMDFNMPSFETTTRLKRTYAWLEGDTVLSFVHRETLLVTEQEYETKMLMNSERESRMKEVGNDWIEYVKQNSDFSRLEEMEGLSEIMSSIAKRPIQFVEATDGIKLACRVFTPKKEPNACVIHIPSLGMTADSYNIFCEQLCTLHNLKVYNVYTRGDGRSEGKRGVVSSPEQLFIDVRTMVRHVRWESLHRFPIVLTAFWGGCGLLMNYWSYDKKDAVDGYAFYGANFGPKSKLMNVSEMKKLQALWGVRVKTGSIAISNLTKGRILGNAPMIKISKTPSVDFNNQPAPKLSLASSSSPQPSSVLSHSPLEEGDSTITLNSKATTEHSNSNSGHYQYSMNFLNAFAVDNVRDKVRHFDRPVTYVLAEESALLEVSTSYEFAQLFPEACEHAGKKFIRHIITIPKVGHFDLPISTALHLGPWISEEFGGIKFELEEYTKFNKRTLDPNYIVPKSLYGFDLSPLFENEKIEIAAPTYIEGKGGVKLSAFLYRPEVVSEKPVVVVIIVGFVGSHLLAKRLVEAGKGTVFALVIYLRGMGASEGKVGCPENTEDYYSDIRSFILHARQRNKRVPLILASIGFVNGVLLNYSNWEGREDADGYLFFGSGLPISDPRKMPPFLKENQKQVAMNEISGGILHGKSKTYKYNEDWFNAVYNLEPVPPMAKNRFSIRARNSFMASEEALSAFSSPFGSVIMENDEFAESRVVVEQYKKTKVHSSRKFIKVVKGGRHFDLIKRQNIELVMPFLASLANIYSDEKLPDFGQTSMSNFNMLKVIGRGAFAEVRFCQHKESGKFFAVKILNKSNLLTSHQVKNAMIEKEILQTIDHPLLLKMCGTAKDELNLFIIMEYCIGGELFTLLKLTRRFNSEIARFYIGQIVLCLEYMHPKHIIYRDLKPENILIDSRGNIKLIDFGFSKILTAEEKFKTHTFAGTPEYLAPEMIENISGYGLEIDLWALGVLAFELLTGKVPFPNSSSLYARILHDSVPLPAYLEKTSKSFITELMEKSVSKRLGFQSKMSLEGPGFTNGVRAHPFFSGFSWQKLESFTMPPPVVPSYSSDSDTNNFIVYSSVVGQAQSQRLQKIGSRRSLNSLTIGEADPIWADF